MQQHSGMYSNHNPYSVYIYVKVTVHVHNYNIMYLHTYFALHAFTLYAHSVCLYIIICIYVCENIPYFDFVTHQLATMECQLNIVCIKRIHSCDNL